MRIIDITNSKTSSILIVILGMIISTLTFFYLQQYQMDSLKQKFETQVDRSQVLFEGKMEVNKQMLDGIVSLYNSSNFVSRVEFRSFTNSIRKNYSFIQALEWIPRVPHHKRLMYEQEVQAEGFENFQIVERDEHGKMVPAKIRDEYYPVSYVEPFVGNQRAFGFDLGSNITRLKGLQKSRDTGKAVATAKVSLVQKSKKNPGILIFAPVYRSKKIPSTLIDKKKMLMGFALGVYNIKDMIEKIIHPQLPKGVNLTVYDNQINDDNWLFGKSNYESLFATQRTLDVLGRKWVTVWHASSLYSGGGGSIGIILISFAVLIFFLLVAYITGMLISRSRLIQSQVAIRTNELKLEIEERKKAETHAQAAKIAGKYKDEFLANVSHEIRTPLNGIIGFIELLADEDLPEGALEYLNMIQNCGISLLRIINDILDISKIQAGKLEIINETFELNQLIDTSVQVFSKLICKKNVKITHSIDPNIPDMLIGDANRLQQVLSNLIRNAVKFTNQGKIEVSVGLAEDTNYTSVKLLFQIKDTGIGISPEVQNKLFTAFEQGSSSINKKFGGTGLGLVICKKLVGLMGGKIWVQSTEGAGSIFYFTIQTKLHRPHIQAADKMYAIAEKF